MVPPGDGLGGGTASGAAGGTGEETEKGGKV